jgi:hypothetical protein
MLSPEITKAILAFVGLHCPRHGGSRDLGKALSRSRVLGGKHGGKLLPRDLDGSPTASRVLEIAISPIRGCLKAVRRGGQWVVECCVSGDLSGNPPPRSIGEEPVELDPVWAWRIWLLDDFASVSLLRYACINRVNHLVSFFCAWTLTTDTALKLVLERSGSFRA